MLAAGAAAAGSLALGGTAGASVVHDAAPQARASRRPHDEFDDTFFDYADPANLSDWVPSIYGAGDQRGAFNQVTPRKTAEALKILDRGAGRGVVTFQLGEWMTNGFPAFVTSPPRTYDQRLTAFGYVPPDDFVGGGIFQGPTPLGRNRIHAHEERFGCELVAGFDEPFSTTYQIGTSLDNLNHAGPVASSTTGSAARTSPNRGAPAPLGTRTWVRSSPAGSCSTCSAAQPPDDRGAAEISAGSTRLTLLGRTNETDFSIVDIGAEGDSPGDLILFADDLLDEAGNAVGHDQVRCSTGFRDELLCDASFVLDGRGQILVAGVAIRGATELTSAITGGTGEFKRVRGRVRETLLPSGDARFVFTLIR